MSYWLDLIGSYIIGGTVILMIVGLNVYISNSAADNLYTNIAQSNITTTNEIIHNDFYKIGYKVPGDKIVIADSNQIKFYSDIDNNGTIDSIYYYTGEISQLTSTQNPNDKLLYRVFNNSSALSSNAVVDFKLIYFDSTGANISYTSLLNQSGRNNIRNIQVFIRVESPVPVDGVYQAAEWQEKIIARNTFPGITNNNNTNNGSQDYTSDDDDGDG